MALVLSGCSNGNKINAEERLSEAHETADKSEGAEIMPEKPDSGKQSLQK